VFYRLAGQQVNVFSLAFPDSLKERSFYANHLSDVLKARLIDDVSGTLPPYDQFIALGPVMVDPI
jgi:hypothetical protein